MNRFQVRTIYSKQKKYTVTLNNEINLCQKVLLVDDFPNYFFPFRTLFPNKFFVLDNYNNYNFFLNKTIFPIKRLIGAQKILIMLQKSERKKATCWQKCLQRKCVMKRCFCYVILLPVKIIITDFNLKLVLFSLFQHFLCHLISSFFFWFFCCCYFFLIFPSHSPNRIFGTYFIRLNN